MALMCTSHSRVQPSQATLFLRSSLKGDVDCGTRLGWIFLPEISFGLTDPMLLESILTSKFFALAVEADDGYIGEAPQKVKCPGCASNLTENQAMQNRVRSRHESLNGRLKNWEILMSMYRHDIMEDGNVFRAVAVITQISINAGKQLFEVDYSDL